MGAVGVDGPGSGGLGEGVVFWVRGVAGVGFCEEEGFADARRLGGGFGVCLAIYSNDFGHWEFFVSFSKRGQG